MIHTHIASSIILRYRRFFPLSVSLDKDLLLIFQGMIFHDDDDSNVVLTLFTNMTLVFS